MSKGFTKLHPGGRREAARDSTPGSASEAGRRLHQVARRHRRSSCCRSTPFIDDSHLLEKGLTNYWGYNSIGFFAPDPRYASDVPNSLREFKEMIARLHDAGLEVILDVVYNHTAEGNELGPTLSFKGIDNASYYRLLPDRAALLHQRHRHRKHAQPQPSPRHPDGDGQSALLGDAKCMSTASASISARSWRASRTAFDTESGFLKAVGQDPVLAAVKLIAEPWDCGPGGYQVGGFPPGWAEWNDTFRDTARDFWRGEASAKALAPRLCASPDKFNHRGRKPWASVNFVTAHDGFTLRDLVSYNDKHNEANGEDNSDGNSDNRSWNCGVEGPTDDAGSQCAARAPDAQHPGDAAAGAGHADGAGGRRVRPHAERQQQRLLPGQRDQLGRLGASDEEHQALTDFFRRLTACATNIRSCAARASSPAPIDRDIDVKDVTWIDADGSEMTPEAWDDDRTHCFGMLMDGRAQPTGVRKRGDDATLLIVFNAHHDLVRFTLPPCFEARGWRRLLDTGDPDSPETEFEIGAVYDVTSRSLLLFERAAAPVL